MKILINQMIFCLLRTFVKRKNKYSFKRPWIFLFNYSTIQILILNSKKASKNHLDWLLIRGYHGKPIELRWIKLYNRVWYLNLGVLVHFRIDGEPLSNTGIGCIYVIWWHSFERGTLSDKVKVIQNPCRYDRWTNALGASFLIGKTHGWICTVIPPKASPEFLGSYPSPEDLHVS